MQQINLYQSMFRPRQVRLAARTMSILLAVLAAVLAAVYGQTWWVTRPLARQVAASTAEVAAGDERLVALRTEYPARKPSPALEQELVQRRTLLNQTELLAQNLRSGAYGSIHGLSPYLEGFARQYRDGTWLTRVQIAAGGNAVGIEGKTLLPELVPAYITRLSQEAAFKGKAFSDLELKVLRDGLNEIGFSVRTQGVAASAEGGS